MADNIQATPRNYLGGLLSDAYKWMQSPERTQQMQGFAGLLGTTGVPQTIERMAYGEPLTNIGRANVPLLKPETADALMTVAPVAGDVAKLAGKGLLGAGRMAGSAVNDAMVYGRGPLASITPQPMRVIEKNPAPFIVKHGTNQPFDEFKSGMGVTAKHIYTTPEEYAQDAAKYGDTLITAQASPKSIIDFSSEGKLDKQTISALKKAAKDAGITDKYYPFESFMDDLMNGQLYQKGGGSRDQDALLSELFSKYQAVKMPDATSGGGISKSVVFEDPSLLKILPDTASFTYPQEEAMRLAQQRAALPVEQGGLGLSPSNTAAERAAAMGFDLDTYHGTDAPNIESLDPKRTKIIEGVFSAFHPKTASMYAEGAAEKGRAGVESAPNVMPLLLNSPSHFHIPEFNKQIIDSFRNSGYAGVQRPEAGVAVTFDPAQIRSRFAAFDPFRKTAATAAAMGVAAPDLLAQQPVISQQQIDEELVRYGLLGR